MPDTVTTIHRHLYFRFGCSYDRKSRLFLCVEVMQHVSYHHNCSSSKKPIDQSSI